ncbi:hypothetical protein [Spiroplasma clarkii]|nr:hypothetical protein [Spiroplasma clarkii]
MKNINLIITAGIAASKALALYELLAKKYNIRLVLTKMLQNLLIKLG